MEKEKEDKKVQSQNKEKINKKIARKMIIVFIVAILIVLSAVLYHKATSKDKKAEEIFGNEYCEAILHMATRDLVKHECKICGTEFQDSSMHADICEKCAEETDRCDFCGKRITEETKAQRENLSENQYKSKKVME